MGPRLLQFLLVIHRLMLDVIPLFLEMLLINQWVR